MATVMQKIKDIEDERSEAEKLMQQCQCWIEFSDVQICSALVWGSSVKHKPQRIGKEHELEDEDVVQIFEKQSRV